MVNKNINKTVSRRKILRQGLYGGIAATLAPGLWLSGCSRFSSGKKPNVLLIVLDTARADRFSFMGYDKKTSPNIDALASDATVFERSYSTCCWTLPSHASLFTGLHPRQAGATSETLMLAQSNTTLAEMLAKNGYDTSAFVCNSWVSKERGFGKGFSDYFEMWRPENKTVIGSQDRSLEEAALRQGVKWIEGRDKSNPFFMFFNLNGTHMPYRPPEPFLSKFAGNRGYNNEEVNRAAGIMSWWGHLAGEVKLSQRDFAIMSDLYDAEVGFADQLVGQIIDKMRTLGVLDDTLVIITSDHGENLGDHGMIDHMLSMYETTLHIPLLIRYPERFGSKIRQNQLVSNIDIFPTIADVCNIKNNEVRVEKLSLANDDREGHKFIIASNERPLTGIALMKGRYPEFDTTKIDHKMRAIRTEQYKLIWDSSPRSEFYDLSEDKQELNDLSAVRIRDKKKLITILDNWDRHFAGGDETKMFESKDEQTLKILRSLGYVE